MRKYLVEFISDSSGMVPFLIPMFSLLVAIIGSTFFIAYSVGGTTAVIAILCVLLVSAFAIILTRYFWRNVPKK